MKQDGEVKMISAEVRIFFAGEYEECLYFEKKKKLEKNVINWKSIVLMVSYLGI